MRRTRLIPVLLIHQGGVYKTTGFTKPIYIGDPINTIRLFNDMEVDEIIVLDIDASKNTAPPNIEFIRELTTEAFMPFAYGGGITSVDQAKSILRCGVEKIILNHSIATDVSLIKHCAQEVGSQSVVASIDYKKSLFGKIQKYDHVKKKTLKCSVIEAAIIAQDAGAGEIMINSVERDGIMKGLDLAVLKEVSEAIKVPLIVCGGAGTLEHLQQAESHGASAIAAGSMLVFKGKQRGVLINYPSESNLRNYLNYS